MQIKFKQHSLIKCPLGTRDDIYPNLMCEPPSPTYINTGSHSLRMRPAVRYTTKSSAAIKARKSPNTLTVCPPCCVPASAIAIRNAR